MPSPGELIGGLVELVGSVMSASTLRLGVGPTAIVLGVLLVLLQLAARPINRWTTRDLGGLAGVPRAMAVAAEAGAVTAVSLGTAGIARSTSALSRLQTLAGLSVLGHIARAAARSGVSLRVAVNDPIAEVAADAVVDAAHHRTASIERRGRAQVAFIGEGRPVMAGMALASSRRAAVGAVAGDMREEGLLLVAGMTGEAAWSSVGTADASQATSVMLARGGAMVGPELFLAVADLRSGAVERTIALAAGRLIGVTLVLLVLASLLAVAQVADLRPFLLGAD